MLTPSLAYTTLTSGLAPHLEQKLRAVVAQSHATSVAYCWAVLHLYDLGQGLSYEETQRINGVVREWRKRNGWSGVGDYKYR
jgi:hypothetical protein